MSVLLVVCDYPHTGHLFAGAFYENAALALKELGHDVQVLAVRPYAPPILSKLVPRWNIYAALPNQEVRRKIPVFRPRNFQIPGIAGPFSIGAGAFVFCRSTARRMHERAKFDTLISFDLQQTGALAWRLGKDLGIPSAGWATGGDMRLQPESPYGRVVMEAMQHLDVVFYQSEELFEIGAANLGITPQTLRGSKHIVLARGIPEPPAMNRRAMRRLTRAAWSVSDDQIVVLNIGRVCRDKGLFDLVQAIRLAVQADRRIVCVQVGSLAGLDESAEVLHEVCSHAGLKQHFRFLPACDPQEVWKLLCGADLFAFTSHHEGMPNSLLEAMAFGVPSVAFAIPPVREIDNGSGAIALVNPFDSPAFSRQVLAIAYGDARRLPVERGQREVSERFSIRTNLSNAISHLESLRR